MTKKDADKIDGDNPEKTDCSEQVQETQPEKKNLFARLIASCFKFCHWCVRETLVIGFTILAFISCFAAWMLSQGPVPLDFATPYLEEAFQDYYPDKTIKIGSTALVWQPNDDALSLRAYDLSLHDGDKPLLALSETDIGISKRDLLMGQIKVKNIALDALAILITKTENGALQLSFHEQEMQAQENSTEETATTPLKKKDFSYTLPKEKTAQSSFSGLAFLDKIKNFSLRNTDIVYHDQVQNTQFHASNVTVLLSRSNESISGSIQSTVILDKDRALDASLNTNIYHSFSTQDTHLTTFFDNLNPTHLEHKLPQFPQLKTFDLPLTGKLDIQLDSALKLKKLHTELRSVGGKVNLTEVYKKPLEVKDLKAVVDFKKETRELSIPTLSFAFEDTPKVTLSAHSLLPDADNPEGNFSAKGVLTAFPMDILKHYWPAALAKEARDWVTNNLSVGISDSASLNITGALTQKDGKITFKEITDLHGDIAFHNMQVDYLPDLPVVTGASGTAHYTADSFDIKAQDGKLMDMNVTSGHIKILDIIKKPKIHIEAKVNGPLKTALHVIDQKPLEYARMFNLNNKELHGSTAIDLTLDFPLYEGLSVQDVQVKTTAKLTDVLLSDAVKSYDLKGGPFTLNVDNTHMSVTGDGTLADAALSFAWRTNFSEKSDFRQRIEGTVNVPSSLFKDFVTLPKDTADIQFMSMPAKFTYTTMHNSPDSKLFLSANVTETDISIAPLSFNKKVGHKGQIDMFLHLNKDGQPHKISGLLLDLPGLKAEGQINLIPGNKGGIHVQSADIENFEMGNTQFSAVYKHDKNAMPRIQITGPYIDLTPLLEKDKDAQKTTQQANKKHTAFEMTIDAARLSLAKGKDLDEVKLFLRRDEKGLTDQMEINGIAGKAPIYYRYQPQGQGHSLQFESSNAGAALASLGITKSIRGGKLVIRGEPVENGDTHDIVGRAQLSNFTVIDMPALARLINALSPTGLQDLLSGDGIYFSRMKASFLWTKKFTNNLQNDVVETITIRKGQTSGASLGLTFEGYVDRTNNIADINGTIVPISQLNKAIGEIPLIGDILTGGSSAVFAATYKIKGPTNKLAVTVNPLATLAPGFIRRLFFE